MNRIMCALTFLVILTPAATLQAQAVDQRFTYQAFVNDGIAPANGVYDLSFSVWDDPAVGASVASQDLEDVSINAGLVNVELDMDNIFNGRALWMQIGVRPGADVNPHTILTPRQRLTAVPYAAGIVPGTYVFRDALGPVLSVENGFPTFAVLVEKTGLDVFTSDGKAIRAMAGDGWAVYAQHFGTNATPAIRAESDATAAGAAALSVELTSDTPGFLSAAIYAQTHGSIAVWGAEDGSGIGVVGNSSESGTGVLGNSSGDGSSSVGVVGTTGSAAGLGGRFENNADSATAIGLRAHGGNGTAPDVVLGGEANSDLGDDGVLSADPRYPGSDVWIRTNDAVVVQLDYDASGDDADFEIRNNANQTIFNVDDSGESWWNIPGGNTTVLIEPSELGNDGAQISLRNDSNIATIILDAEFNDGGVGRITTQEIEITGGADLSEYFNVAPASTGVKPEPGMVVSIDPARLGELIVSTSPYDRTVAGIISGAGGVRTGFMMGQKGTTEADGAHAVALTGRVYVMADASFGAIQPGDLLTSSATPGHAMKVTDHARATGAIIGKAMSRLDAGRGLVLVLVSLH